MIKHKKFTLEDMVHFIIYRELDKLKIISPYKTATMICNDLREAVEYRKNNQSN